MNLARQLEEYLPKPLWELVQDLSRKAAKDNQGVYLVGGVVRDLLLGIPPLGPGLRFDLDLVVEGNAVKLAQRAAKTGQAKLLTHQRFGTAKLRYKNFTIDLATARKETYAKPGALPAVSPGTLEDDLSRRDFSINAMAISLVAKDYGELIDPHHGKSDLEHRLIRVLHPQSFRDDATRILRAVRYEQRLGFELETQTAQLLKRDIHMLDTISGDRVRHELELIFREARPELVINRLGELRILQRISFPLKGDGWIAEKFEKARRLKKPSQLVPLYFCLLIYPLSERELEQFVGRVKTSAKLSEAMRDTLRLKAQLGLLDKPPIKHSEIYYLLREYEPVAVQANAIATNSSPIRQRLQLFLTKLRYVKTSLNGKDLQRLGISAGPEIGKILQVLHKAKLDSEVRTTTDEERLVLSLRAATSPTEQKPT